MGIDMFHLLNLSMLSLIEMYYNIMNIGCLLYNCIGYGMLIELYLVQSGLEISTELEILAGASYFY